MRRRAAFGAVFLNVTQANTTSIQYFNGNELLDTVFAPVGGQGFAELRRRPVPRFPSSPAWCSAWAPT